MSDFKLDSIKCEVCENHIDSEFYCKLDYCNHIYCHKCMKKMLDESGYSDSWDYDEVYCKVDNYCIGKIGVYNTNDNKIIDLFSMADFQYFLLKPKIPIFIDKMNDYIKDMLKYILQYERKKVSLDMFSVERGRLTFKLTNKSDINKLLDKIVLIKNGFLHDWSCDDQYLNVKRKRVFDPYYEDDGSESDDFWDRRSDTVNEEPFLKDVFEYFTNTIADSKNVEEMIYFQTKYQLLKELRDSFLLIVSGYNSVFDVEHFIKTDHDILKYTENRLNSLKTTFLKERVLAFRRKLLKSQIFKMHEYEEITDFELISNKCLLCLQNFGTEFGRLSECQHKLCVSCVYKWFLTKVFCPFHKCNQSCVMLNISDSPCEISAEKYYEVNLEDIIGKIVSLYSKYIPDKFRILEETVINFKQLMFKYNSFLHEFDKVKDQKVDHDKIVKDFLSGLTNDEQVSFSCAKIEGDYVDIDKYQERLEEFKFECSNNEKITVILQKRLEEIKILMKINRHVYNLHSEYGHLGNNIREICVKLKDKGDYWKKIKYWISITKITEDNIWLTCSKLKENLKKITNYRVYLTKVRQYKQLSFNLLNDKDIPFEDKYGLEDSIEENPYHNHTEVNYKEIDSEEQNESEEQSENLFYYEDSEEESYGYPYDYDEY